MDKEKLKIAYHDDKKNKKFDKKKGNLIVNKR